MASLAEGFSMFGRVSSGIARTGKMLQRHSGLSQSDWPTQHGLLVSFDFAEQQEEISLLQVGSLQHVEATSLGPPAPEQHPQQGIAAVGTISPTAARIASKVRDRASKA